MTVPWASKSLIVVFYSVTKDSVEQERKKSLSIMKLLLNLILALMARTAESMASLTIYCISPAFACIEVKYKLDKN